MLALSKIWSNRLNVIAANLKFDEREYREVAATAEHVRWDYHGRFLIELIQNAADQATGAGLTDSEVIVLRTTEFLAVLNQGRPLDDDGFRALTSLAYDTKDPALTIGNKGLGFKAILQVSDSPEVYSAPLHGGGLLAEGGYRFAFSQKPLAHPALRQELQRVAAEFEHQDPLATQRIRERYSNAPFDEILLAEAGHGAAFRFPLPRDALVLEERIAVLGLRRDDIAKAGALVVLPLKAGQEVQRWVDTAAGELVDDRDAATVLFLTGVGTIRYEDHRNGITHILEQCAIPEPVATRSGPGHGRISRCTTRHSRVALGATPELRTRQWWVCSRTVGRSEDSDPETAAEERGRILNAVTEFPGEHWARVDHASVDVALPIPSARTPRGRPLGTAGLFCIGLPTRMRTGAPLWVNARFHGNIAREKIDVAQNTYNQILFEEALRLVGDLLEFLKSADGVDTRRLATLVVESSTDAPLGQALRRPDGPARRDIVLGADGISFMPGRAVALPRAADAAMFRLLSKGGLEPGGYFTLPDEWLMRNARAVLRQLGASEGPSTGPDIRYLERNASGSSLVEHSARLHRNSGPPFWQPFLRWMLTRFTGALLADQHVLPTGADALSAATEKVYAAPTLPASALDVSDTDDPQRLDRVIARRLPLFDERCSAVREADGIKYTELGTQLRRTEPPLLREPALADLVREVFGPRVRELASTPGNEVEAIGLLGMVGEWAQLRDIVKSLPLSSLRVPTEEVCTEEWIWSDPTHTYFGKGWQDPETDSLLARAYGSPPGRLLVPWAEFAAVSRARDDDRERWLAALRTLGVRGQPRLRRIAHSIPPLQAYSYAGPLARSSSSRCPGELEGVHGLWNAYIEAIRQRRTSVASGQVYDVASLLWLDGLELDDARQNIVELVLRRPQLYEPHLSTELCRVSTRGDSTDVPSLWAFALRHAGWRIIPTSHGLVAPDEAWLLVGEQRRRRRGPYRFLPCVVESVEPAERLLLAIGVATLDEASPERYVRALQGIAARISDFRPDEMRDAIVLTEELYRELQAHLVSEAVELSILLERPLPMFDGIERRRLCAVDLRDRPVILVDDNPVRARFVEGAHHTPVLPISSRRGYEALATAIEAQVGEGQVRYTKNAPAEIGFVSKGGVETTVGAFLDRVYPSHLWRRDIALLLSLGAATGTLPEKRIRDVLHDMDSVRLRFGTFARDAGTSSFLDEYDDQGPSLLVDESLRSLPDQVFAATWELVRAHRDLWASYATALRDKTTDRFLAERGISAADIRDVEVLLDPARARRFDVVKPVLLAIGLASGAIKDAVQFATRWPEHIESADNLALWIGRTELADVIALGAASDDEESASLRILDAAGVSVDDWQRAREGLGLPLHLFARSRESYQRAQELVAAALMAAAAHAVSVDLAAAKHFIESIRSLAPTDDLLRSFFTPGQMLPHVLKSARTILDSGPVGSLAVLQSRLDEALAADVDGSETALQGRAARREVDEYRLPEAVRSASAQRDVHLILAAADRLAAHLGESLDTTAVAHQDRVAALASGWWANRFAVLDALRQALEGAAPLTTKRLSEARAFRDPGPPGVLIGRLPELAEDGPPPAPPTPVAARAVDVVGVHIARGELDQDLIKGSDGKVGTELQQHAKLGVDFEDLRHVEAPSPRMPGRRGGWSGGSRSGGESQDEREINGLLGEAFVYELFRQHLPGFDYQCWRSMNAVRYGVATEGDDTLGADFIYRDLGGVLTGRTDAPEVYLEVKATSGAGGDPFDVSAGEWETALRIHLEGGAQAYAIVRVAHVRSAPVLHRIFLDPVRLSGEGLLVVEQKDLRVRGA